MCISSPRLSPLPLSISQPISLGVYTGSAVHPSPASGAAQGEAGRLQRPARAPRPQQTAAPAPAAPSRCAGVAEAKARQPASGTISCSLARSLRSEKAKPGSPSDLSSKMKKLQGAHLRKVGHEGRPPKGGVQRPARSRAPWEGWTPTLG